MVRTVSSPSSALLTLLTTRRARSSRRSNFGTASQSQRDDQGAGDRAAGVEAIEQLTAHGVNVNVTLLFSVERYEQVIEAYLRGLERRVADGEPVDGDRLRRVVLRLASRRQGRCRCSPADSWLRGRVAVANAQLAYARYLDRFAGERWEALERAGARQQRPLWASTGTKDPTYSDVLYVERLIAPGVINTMPEKTLRAFADHGEADAALHGDAARRAERSSTRRPAKASTSTAITAELEREGVRSFSACAPWEPRVDVLVELLEALVAQLARGRPARAARLRMVSFVGLSMIVLR